MQELLVFCIELLLLSKHFAFLYFQIVHHMQRVLAQLEIVTFIYQLFIN